MTEKITQSEEEVMPVNQEHSSEDLGARLHEITEELGNEVASTEASPLPTAEQVKDIARIEELESRFLKYTNTSEKEHNSFEHVIESTQEDVSAREVAKQELFNELRKDSGAWVKERNDLSLEEKTELMVEREKWDHETTRKNVSIGATVLGAVGTVGSGVAIGQGALAATLIFGGLPLALLGGGAVWGGLKAYHMYKERAHKKKFDELY